MEPFAYPSAAHARRHGPLGYAHHESFRPWLRDEFAFRCVYCLAREQWGKGHYDFVVDHLLPQASDPGLATDYENLLYSCFTCNAIKSNAQDVPDPCKIAYGDGLAVSKDGSIEALNADGQTLIEVLRVDNEENTQYRRLILDIIELARRNDPQRLAHLMAFPEDLPNLSRKRPPGGNSRPAGLHESFFAKRKRGQLPDAY